MCSRSCRGLSSCRSAVRTREVPLGATRTTQTVKPLRPDSSTNACTSAGYGPATATEQRALRNADMMSGFGNCQHTRATSPGLAYTVRVWTCWICRLRRFSALSADRPRRGQPPGAIQEHGWVGGRADGQVRRSVSYAVSAAAAWGWTGTARFLRPSLHGCAGAAGRWVVARPSRTRP